MQNWKKALVLGSLGAGAALLITGRRNVGLASVAGGLALLASEYPERFEEAWENAPAYIQRASQIFATISRLGEKFAEQVAQRTVESLEDFAE